MDIINHYCYHEAGVRNLKKALDRVFRKIVAKLENQTSVADSVPSPQSSLSPEDEMVEY